MARGTVIGEPVVSQAGTDEFRAGYERTFGDKKPQRGRWVATPEGLVPADEYVPPSRALDAPILAGRFYEGARSIDGEDIGSRTKHREYMRRHGVTAASDFSPKYYEGVKTSRKRETKKSRRETIARKLYDMDKP